MNISTIINDIKLPEALWTIALPFNKPTEEVLRDIIESSIRTFSNYNRLKKDCLELMKNLDSPDELSRLQKIYFLPPALTTTDVFTAHAVAAAGYRSQSGEVNTNAFTVGSPFVGFGSYYPQDILNAVTTGAAINKYAGITSKPPSSAYLGFNKIQLFDFPDNIWAHFFVECNHDPSGETIKESCRNSFMHLATLDVQRTLYNVLKNMNGVGGAFKDVKLNIESWAGAEAARRALLDKWDASFHLDDTDLWQFF